MSIKIALAGNPNCGKTTLFNALTGANQFVGNWPGVTVEKKEGRLKGHKDVVITDLPGIYSLSPYTLEEVVSRNYLLRETPDVIINLIEGTNPERNLYLTTQILELGIPVVVAVNMIDLVRKNGDKFDLNRLSKELGCEVVEISALKGTGITQMAEKVVALAKNRKTQFYKHKFSLKTEDALAKITEICAAVIPAEQKHWYAVKLLERDEKLMQNTALGNAEKQKLNGVINTLETELDDDSESIVANERYTYIAHVMQTCVKKKQRSLTTSDKIDRVVTNRWLALPIFAVVMFFIYFISVTTVGAWVTDWVNDGMFGDGFPLFDIWVPGIPILLGNALNALRTADWLNSLLIDGIVAGVGAVLGFVPQMLVLFLFLAFLEACGYMARIAFIMDRIFRKFGLSGKSFIPILIGTGCGVPGIMASRTIENERDRRMTIMTTTFIPCGAKLPIIALIAGALFGGAWWVSPSAYFVGIAAIICSGIILKKTKAFAGEPAPFVMELPAYHMPTVGNLLRSMWERGWSFIKKAGTVILLATILIWFLQGFGFENGFGMVENMNHSILAKLGGIIAPVFAPLGWGDWKATVAAITGLIAKENVVGTLGILYNFSEVAEDGAEIWGTLAASYTTLAAYSFLVFNLLCAPCFSAIGAIRREMNSAKWTWFAIGYQCGFAYFTAFCIYQLGNLFVGNFGIGTVIAILFAVAFLYLLFRPNKSQNRLKIDKNALPA